MSIKGTGIDLVDVQRIERIITTYQDRFLQKVFTASEIEYCSKRARPALHFSGRWAVKEAFYKALPVHCQYESSWRSIQVVSSKRGKPMIEICSQSLKDALERIPIIRFHVSITHELHTCAAFVILE